MTEDANPDSGPLCDPDALLVSAEGGVAWVTLNRPTRKNAIDQSLRARLADRLAELDADPGVRVVVITGAGDAFCAGVDLKEAPVAPGPVPSITGSLPPVAAALGRMRKPTIAAVNGPALGGGFELVLAADIRIAADTARFALTEVRIGSMPGSGGTQRLVRAVPRAIAMHLLLTGDAVDAAEALHLGLLSEVVPADALRDRAAAIAARIASNAPLSVLAIKASVRAGERDLEAGLAAERQLWDLLSTTEDREEGRAAFRQKRPPEFKGR
jgi:enoyl-CoA hydratase/carnithine racemase